MLKSRTSWVALFAILHTSAFAGAAFAVESSTPVQIAAETQAGEYFFSAPEGLRGLRISFPEPSMVRIQHFSSPDHHLPDGHYRSVLDHTLTPDVTASSESGVWKAETADLQVEVDLATLLVSVTSRRSGAVLAEGQGARFDSREMSVNFQYRAEERFAGLGHPPMGNRDRLELTGEVVSRNYGEDGVPSRFRGAQGHLLVPLLMSSSGYGVFFNTTYPNRFEVGAFDSLSATFDHGGEAGEIDYYVFAGPDPAAILDQYTRLTGRPLLPPKWAFGLQLSDNEPEQGGLIDADWWKREVEALYAAGYPLDHMVFDNDWRAGSGAWSGSVFEFSEERFPDPAAFAEWYRGLGLTVTLDLNMNIANDSAGWDPAYTIPVVEGCLDNHGDSYPDYTDPAVRQWVWDLFRTKAFDPQLGWPGEAIWMDETDAIFIECVPDETRMHNGRTWRETRNEYYLHLSEAIIDGWFATMLASETEGLADRRLRPFVWGRGGSAGGQRLATHWTGDIYHDSAAMEEQVIALQASGLAAYPYFNHDAGGFVGGREDNPWPEMGGRLTDQVYTDWAMAFGSFTPIWRPHGYAAARWPTRRSEQAQEFARIYATLRYEMMPYIYSMAIEAAETGMPMARPMMLAYGEEPQAWNADDQYMWGDAILVAPSVNMSGRAEEQSIWLPGGHAWYDFWTNETYRGGQTLQYAPEYGYIPLFVRAGAIIPEAPFALNTASQPNDILTLRVYAGGDGSYVLHEDDGRTMDYQAGAIRRTRVDTADSEEDLTLNLYRSEGDFSGAPHEREIAIEIVGLSREPMRISVFRDGEPTILAMSQTWDATRREARITLGRQDVATNLSIVIGK